MQPVLLNKAAVSGDPHQLIAISSERDSWEINQNDVGERSDQNSTTLHYAYCSPVDSDKFVIRRPDHTHSEQRLKPTAEFIQHTTESQIREIQRQLDQALKYYMQDTRHRKLERLHENVLKETAAFLHSRTSEASDLLLDALQSYWVRWGTG